MKSCSTCGYFSINGGGFYKGQPHCKNKQSPKFNTLVAPDKRCCDLHTEPHIIKAEKICKQNVVDAVKAISHVRFANILWAILDCECNNKKRPKILVAIIRRLHKLKKQTGE